MTHPFKQRGTAIIVALFVTALVAAAAIIMLDRLHIDIRRTELSFNTNQANFYAQGSIAWAMDQLNNDWKFQQPNKVIDPTPIQSPIKQMDNFTISSVIYDAQGYFNLNNLTDSGYQTNFIRLLQIMAPNIDQTTAQNIMLAIVDWISPQKKSELEEYYATLSPPYHAPHHAMVSASELRLVKGMTADLYAKLSPYVIALPKSTAININNAPIPILMCLSPTMTLESAKTIDAFRKQTPFANLQDFLNSDVVKNNPLPQNNITTTSSYFLVQTNVKVGQQNMLLYTLLERILKNSQPTAIVLWQSKGTL